jgi:LuxR family maltose regulon positive regulatory protein
LIGTSTLPRLCADLCDHVLGVDDSATPVHRIESSNLFLIALDERRTWFRYHALFRQALQAKLAEWPSRVRADIAARAGVWFETHGLIEDAVEQAIMIEDHDRVATMTEQHALALIREGRAVTLARWIEALPEEMLVSRPRIVVAQLLASLGPSGFVAERYQLVARAWEARHRHRDDWTPYDDVMLELMTSQSHDDDIGAALESGRRALDLAHEHAADLLVAALAGYGFNAFLAGMSPKQHLRRNGRSRSLTWQHVRSAT